MRPNEHPLVRTYRELLRVGPDATIDDLRRSYRQLALVYHPDKTSNPTSAEVFIRIKQAYDALRDPNLIRQLNRTAQIKADEITIGGLTVRFGSFFGCQSPSAPPPRRGGHLPTRPAGQRRKSAFSDLAEADGGSSILDDVAFDYVEVVFAGRFSKRDTSVLWGAFEGRDFDSLPWYALNNQGIVQFFDRDFAGALATYEQLNSRIPNNVVFLYRLGVCHEIVAHEKPRKPLFRKERPDPEHLRAAIDCFTRAIELGEMRVPTQDCLTIRRALAGLLDRMGRIRGAENVRESIRDRQKWRRARETWAARKR